MPDKAGNAKHLTKTSIHDMTRTSLHLETFDSQHHVTALIMDITDHPNVLLPSALPLTTFKLRDTISIN